MVTTLVGFTRLVACAVIPGGAAGDHAVPGNIKDGDSLISVRRITGDLVTNVDLSSEFSIKAGVGNTIENALGTDTTGDFLIATWALA